MAIQNAERILRIKLARSGLLPYIRYVFPGEFIVNKHHVILCQEIDDWITSETPYNLMAFMPPRHGKSQICSIMTPGYIFGRNPDAQISAASYGADLIQTMSREAQKVMASEKYAAVFPHTKLVMKGNRTDENAIRREEEFTIQHHRGHYRCAGIGGGLTGHGADYGIIDDPIKDRREAESATVRETCWDWYRSVFRTRLQKHGRVLLLMTRWHMDDLAGRLIQKMKDDPKADYWKIISFPGLFEQDENTHPLDHRQPGEALWPWLKNEGDLLQIKATLGSYDWESLYQQHPKPPGGAVLQRSWLKMIEPDAVPPGLTWVRAWDLAVSKKETADYTASGQMAIDTLGNVYVRRFVRQRMTWPETRREIIGVAHGEPDCVVGLGGPGLAEGFIQDLQAEPQLQMTAVVEYPEDKDKLTRALPWVARAEAGKFFVVRGAGTDAYIEELIDFTGMDDPHDDQVDWTSGAYRMLAEPTVETEIVQIPAWLQAQLENAM